MQTPLPDGMTKRGKSYWADFRHRGQRIRKSLSRNLKTATTLLTELRARLERGDYGIVDNDCRLDLLEKQFLQHCRQTIKPGSLKKYTRSLANILPAMPQRVRHLTAASVMSYRDKRIHVDQVKANTVNQEVDTLGRLLRWAVNQRLIGCNPLDKIKPLPVEEFGSRALEPNEVDYLLAFSPPHWRDIWYAYLVTGMRNQELATLTFDDIDWEAREIIVRAGHAKSGRERRIPIDDGLWDILKHQEATRHERRAGTNANPKYSAQVATKLTHDHVFVSTANTWMRMNCIHAAMMRCCGKAGIETKTFDAAGNLVTRVDVHSLRKTFATELIESGADPKSVQELLGHQTLEITMRLYAKVRRGTKRQAVGRLSYGRGVQAPAHLIEFPNGANDPTTHTGVHKMSTTGSGPDGRQAQAVAE